MFDFKPLFMVMLLALGACATATPYQPATGVDGGYADQKIESNRWSISFAGNTLTDRQTVETYLLYRAAELTVTNGFDHFQIVSRDTDETTSFVSTGFSSPFFYNFYGFGPHTGFRTSGFRARRFDRFNTFGGFYDPFFGAPSSFNEVVRYEAVAEVIMGQGSKPSGAEFFNAHDVLENLGPAVLRPATGP